MKRVLITGANSYIGNSFANYMAQWPGKYAVTTIDMVDGKWRDVDFSGYDVIYHVAGIAHVDTGAATAQEAARYYAVNTGLAIETAKKAKAEGVKQFIFMSSMIVYGESAPIGVAQMITKDTIPEPASFYGESKLKAEEGLQKLQDDTFKVVILRPPMIYGKGCKGNYPTLAKYAQRLPIFPDIDNQRSMLYVENLMEFVRLMIENEETGTFFPQNSEYTRTSEMVELIASAHGKTIKLTKRFNRLLLVMGKRMDIVDKAFGNFCYAQDMSEYKMEYRVCDLVESIRRTEGA